MRKIFLFLALVMLASILAATAGSVYYFDLLEDVYKENRMADNSFAVVGENNTLYRFALSDTTYTVNGTSVLWTGRGGASRWLAVGGQYSALAACMGAYADSSVTDSCAVGSTWYAHGGTYTLQYASLFTAATTYTPGFRYTGIDSLQFVVTWHMTLSGDSDSMTVRGGVLVDSVYVTGSQMGTFLRDTGHSQTLSGMAVVGLASGSEVQIAVWTDTAADKITIDYITVAIRRLY